MIEVEGHPVSFDDLLSDVQPSDFHGVSLDIVSPDPKDIFAESKRKGWGKLVEARCDFQKKVRLTKRSDIYFLTLWQKSVKGRTLTDIKSDDDMIPFFSQNIAPLVIDVYGVSLAKCGWAMCVPPRRRHKERNFATLVAERLSKDIGIPFYEEVAQCHSRQRINAVFSLISLPKEPNIIVFDDIVTTGQTLKAMFNLLTQYDKSVFFVAGINNIL